MILFVIYLINCKLELKKRIQFIGFAVHGSGHTFARDNREFDGCQLEKIQRLPGHHLQQPHLRKQALP